MSWNNGCFTDINYAASYQYNLSPANLELCLLFAGKKNLTHSKKIRYLEFGFGHGLSLSIHAAVCDGEFWGVDFNPNFAVMADQLAQASEVDLKICNSSFKEFSERKDLPDFDIIVMHGVWSWVSQANQEIVIDFLKRKLSVGGIFYVSYNTPIGKWATLLPLRNLMKLHYDRASNRIGAVKQNVVDAIEYASNVVATQSSFANYASLIEEINAIKKHNIAYVAGEYLGDHWNLTQFSEMAELLSQSKLEFGSHAELLENVDNLFLTESSRVLLKNINDPVLKEATRDLVSSHSFRSDIWLKGEEDLSLTERMQLLCAIKFVLILPIDEIGLSCYTQAGEIELPIDIYQPILECLAENGFTPKSADELVDYYQLRSIKKNQIIDALITLTAIHYARPVQENRSTQNTHDKSVALNTYLLEQAVYGGRAQHLASPVIGCGVAVSRVQQLFLLARMEGASTPSEWASLAWQLISQQEQVKEIEGKPVTTPAEGIAMMTAMANEFAEKKLPLLQVLGVIE